MSFPCTQDLGYRHGSFDTQDRAYSHDFFYTEGLPCAEDFLNSEDFTYHVATQLPSPSVPRTPVKIIHGEQCGARFVKENHKRFQKWIDENRQFRLGDGTVVEIDHAHVINRFRRSDHPEDPNPNYAPQCASLTRRSEYRHHGAPYTGALAVALFLG